MEKHVPVLLNEVLDELNIKPSGIYVDLTIGRGGHAKEILKRLNSCGYLVGFDQDDVAISESQSTLSQTGKRFTLVHDNFKNLQEDLHKLNIKHVDGFLMDLGVSSPQFDEISRGFSYKERAILDMRMDQRQSLTAEQVINTYSLKDLTRVFRDYGEDKYAYQIAKKIIKVREDKEIVYTDELVELIKSVKPMRELAKKGHPAKQIFQALRIEVNDEFGVLRIALESALQTLNHGGRLVVITFHSGEDKIVKDTFKKYAVIEGTRKNVFSLPDNSDAPQYRLCEKKAIVPSEEEISINHRAHSAKLRVIERI
jgi:16S rRNA (cytosine1402-N4)-methyltransferase